MQPVVTIYKKLRLYLKSQFKFNHTFALKIGHFKSIYKLQVQSNLNSLSIN